MKILEPRGFVGVAHGADEHIGGESLFGGLDLRALGYRVTQSVAGEKGMHYVITRG